MTPPHPDHILETLTRELFQRDPGELPEILVQPLTGASVRRGFRLLCDGSGRLVGNPTLFDPEEQEEAPLYRLADPAELGVSGRVRPFHVLIRGVQISSVALPDLGVLVLKDGLAIDYEQGPAWERPQVGALLHLLAEIRSADPAATVQLERHVASDLKETLAAYLDTAAVFPREEQTMPRSTPRP